MKWVEIISIRLNQNNPNFGICDLQDLVKSSVKQQSEFHLKLYRHPDLSTDFSIFIYYQLGSHKTEDCNLGIQLAWILEEFGLVNHTIWLEAGQE
jgi:hypothetical protein